MASYEDLMSLSVRRGFLWPAVDPYGGFAGFYDYGHNGVLLRRRWEDAWIETFLGLSDNYHLIDTTTILPYAALKASGHVDQFTDLLVTCTRCGESYRADHLLESVTHEEHEGITAEMIAQYGLNHILFDYFAVTFKSFWAQFGWMGVLVNDRIYVVLMVLSGAAALGFVLFAWRVLRRRDTLTATQWWGMGLLAVTLVASVADYIGYNFEFFQLQGRYVFPAIIPIALFGVIGLREILAREYHRVFFVLLYLALLALDAASLFLFIVPQLRIVN